MPLADPSHISSIVASDISSKDPKFLVRTSNPRIFLVISLAILGFTLVIPSGPSSIAAEQGIPSARLPLTGQSSMITITGLSPNPGNPGRTIRLNFTAQDPNSNITATWVDWGDGSTPDLIFNMTSSGMCQAPDMCAIAPGDLLFAKPEDPSSIVNGSIIIFRPDLSIPSFLVAHRVVWIFPPNETSTQYVFWTKGDANAQKDSWNTGPGTPASQVLAVYQYTTIPLASSTERTDTHAFHVLGGLPSKAFTITVNATTVSGSQTQVTTTMLINDAPPTIGITGAGPNPLISGSRLTLSLVATDPDGIVSTITINWGDGTTPQNFPDNSAFETHVYNNPGNYTIVVQATDDASLTSIPSYTTIKVGALPSGAAPAAILGLEPLIFYGITAAVIVILGAAAVLVIRSRKTPLQPSN